VNGYLLDTRVALLSLMAPERISAEVRREIEGGRIYLSVVSYWEVLLKCTKGKLDVGDPRTWWPEALEKLTATSVPLRPNHISEIYNLKPIHQDPFDRALIAQATVEDLMLVTTDAVIPRYATERFRVIDDKGSVHPGKKHSSPISS
jgi:PIN domain nuclease of toxin-antitoxin system